MGLWEILILAIVQGLTEFLPVSSSGHLVVANALREALGGEPTPDLVELSVVLHLGTLAAVLVFYRREIVGLLTCDRRVIGLLFVATLPAVVIGLVIEKGLDGAGLENALLAGLMFPVTAAGLLWASRQPRGGRDYQQLSVREAWTIGWLQALAILPGISRSGSTLVGGLAVGLRREAAAAFAFLMAIPVIAGGGLLKAVDAWQSGGTQTSLELLLLGFSVSLGVGLLALRILLDWLCAGRLNIFAWYLLPLGAAVLIWQLASLATASGAAL